MARAYAGVQVDELARRLKVHRATVHGWEHDNLPKSERLRDDIVRSYREAIGIDPLAINLEKAVAE